jgi:hypothetical protein
LSDLSLSGFFHFKEVFNERNSNSDRKQHTALFPQDHRQDHLCGACPFQETAKETMQDKIKRLLREEVAKM